MGVIVLLEVQVKPESVDDFKAFLQAILPDTRAYEGCESVDVYENQDASTNVVFYERWETREQQMKYMGWRTETGVLGQLAGMLSAPPSIRYYDRLDA